MTETVVAQFTNNGVPLVTPADAPTLRIRRTDTGALVVTDDAMTELGDGAFTYSFILQDATLDYIVIADADPLANGQVSAGERYSSVGISKPTGDSAHLSQGYNGTTIDMIVWIDRTFSHGVTPPGAPTLAVVDWYNPDGTLLFQETDNTPDAQGIFRMTRAQALVGNTAYYAIVSVTDPLGTVSTERGVPTIGS